MDAAEIDAGWRRLNSPSWPETAEVNEVTGDFRLYPPDHSPEDGLSGDREPRNPKTPPPAGAVAVKLVPLQLPDAQDH
jgi:hypothetical protein